MTTLTNDRIKELLKISIEQLEDKLGVETILGTDLEDELGITEEEYYDIMGW